MMDLFIVTTIHRIHVTLRTNVLGLPETTDDNRATLRPFLMTLDHKLPIEVVVLPWAITVHQKDRVWRTVLIEPAKSQQLGQQTRIKMLDALRALELPGVSDYVLTPPGNGKIDSVVFKMTAGFEHVRAQLVVSAV